MPTDITVLHLLAIVLLTGSWIFYSMALRILARGSLNAKLYKVRIRWMALSPNRSNRMFDALLLGHMMHGLSFFGSATLLVLAGVIGLFVQMQNVYDLVNGIGFLEHTSLELFAIKILILGLLLLISFFLFIYALRKLTYTLALIAALPEKGEKTPSLKKLTDATAVVLSESVKSYNEGIRGYYFAVASLFLFVSPIACIIVTLFMMAMLFYRQTGTPTARAIEEYVNELN